jgi:hypothetical protein
MFRAARILPALAIGVSFCDYQDIKSKFVLLGEGIRQVTFLYVNAYEIKLHIPKESIKRLQSTTRWTHEFTVEKFLKPIGQNWFVSDLVEHSDLAIEIVPCRATDGAHLRNGFVRLLNQRLAKANEKERSDYENSVTIFRGIIPNKPVPKGASMMFYKQKDLLKVYYDGQELGAVQSPTLTRWFFEQYLTSTATPSFTNSVAKGLHQIFNK